MQSLGIITPDYTDSLGYIYPEAQQSLGIITPDYTAMLGRPTMVMGIPLQTWLTVTSLSAVGAGLGGWAASRSAKGSAACALSGALGSAVGIALTSMLASRQESAESSPNIAGCF
jgi:hypothetical protein